MMIQKSAGRGGVPVSAKRALRNLSSIRGCPPLTGGQPRMEDGIAFAIPPPRPAWTVSLIDLQGSQLFF